MKLSLKTLVVSVLFASVVISHAVLYIAVRMFKRGTVVANYSDETYNVDNFDGTVVRGLSQMQIRRFVMYKENEYCYAYWLGDSKNKSAWYPAKIMKVHNDGTIEPSFDIVYEDLVAEENLPMWRIARPEIPLDQFVVVTETQRVTRQQQKKIRQRKYYIENVAKCRSATSKAWMERKEDYNTTRKNKYMGKYSTVRHSAASPDAEFICNSDVYNAGRTFYAADLKEEDVPVNSIGKMENSCVHCAAKYFALEATCREKKYTLCCQGNTIRIPRMTKPPPLIEKLLLGDSVYSRLFKEHSIYVNSSVSFASIKAEQVFFTPGVPAFKIQGRVYHMIGPVINNRNSAPKWQQTYFIEGKFLLHIV